MRVWVVLLLVCLPTFAHADGEGWLITETRFPVYRSENGVVLRLRLITDFRVAGRTKGIQQALFRGGLIIQPLPWLWFSTQTTFNAQPSGQSETGSLLFQEEFRQEFEVNFGLSGDWGRFAHRHRAELRLINHNFAYRHRIQARVAFGPSTWRLWPLVYDEFHIDPTGFFNQNRLGAGVEISLLPTLRMELTYVLKSRSTGSAPNFGVEHDHVARVYLIYSADKMF